MSATQLAAADGPTCRCRNYKTELQRWYQFMELREGREKLSRFIQMMCKYAKWRIERSTHIKYGVLQMASPIPSATDWYQTLNVVHTTFSTTSKILRLFREIQTWNNIQQCWKMLQQPPKIHLSLQHLQRISTHLQLVLHHLLFVYLVADHLTLAIRLQLVKVTEKRRLLVERISLNCWLAESVVIAAVAVTTMIINQKQLALLRSERQAITTSASTAPQLLATTEHDDAKSAEYEALRLSQQRQLIKIARQCLDFPVVCSFLGYIGSPATHGIYGLLGAASSLLGMCQHYVKPVYLKQLEEQHVCQSNAVDSEQLALR